MAKAIPFKEANIEMKAPPGMEDLVEDVQVFGVKGPRNSNLYFTCWALTDAEIEEVKRTGVIWVGIMGGPMQPVMVSGTKPFTPHISTPAELAQDAAQTNLPPSPGVLLEDKPRIVIPEQP